MLRALPDYDALFGVDFTNPTGLVTQALLDHGHRAIGLCNVAIGLQRFTAGLLGVEPRQVLVDQVGAACHTGTRTCFDDGLMPSTVG